jgi:Na+/H+ antiporter NhaD/arsenite permease-like protein
VITWILTELMSNNAAAALAFPVAIGVAEQLGLAPMPFVMAVLYGASCSFITPYGYQTNLMVMSPGRYGLGDFVRAGTPLALVYMAICLVACRWPSPSNKEHRPMNRAPTAANRGISTRQLVESRCGAVAVGPACLLPSLSSDGAQVAWP